MMASGLTRNRDKGIVQPRALDRERADAGIAFDQASQQRLDPRIGHFEHPRRAVARGAVGQGCAPRAILVLGLQTHLRRQAVAR